MTHDEMTREKKIIIIPQMINDNEICSWEIVERWQNMSCNHNSLFNIYVVNFCELFFFFFKKKNHRENNFFFNYGGKKMVITPSTHANTKEYKNATKAVQSLASVIVLCCKI